MGSEPGIRLRHAVDARSESSDCRLEGCRWQWPVARESGHQSHARGSAVAHEPAPLKRLLQVVHGDRRSKGDIAELLPRQQFGGSFSRQNRHAHRRAFCFRNPSDQRWSPICEHDFQRSTRSECNDRAGASLSATAQPVPFIDLRRDAARRAREIGTASEPPRSPD